MAWLTDWEYRKSHTINPATGAGANYQVKITVHYGSGTDSGADVYLNSHCKTDFGDVRFTDDDGETELDYWMEEKVDSDYAIFWVEVADSLESSAQVIYVYYGNSGAATTSDGEATFVFFDDFLGSSIDTNKWSGDTSQASVSGGICTLTGKSGDSIIQGKVFASVPYAIEMKAKFETDKWSGSGLMETNKGNSYIMNLGYGTGTYLEYIKSSDEGVSVELQSNWTEGSYIRLTILWQSDEVNFLEAGTELTNSPITDASKIPTVDLSAMVYAGASSSNHTYVDWILLRKYTDPEPAHGAWGSEETPVVGGVYGLEKTTFLLTM